MDRRSFLKATAAAGLYAAVVPACVAEPKQDWAKLASVDRKPIKPIDDHIFSTGHEIMVSSDHPLATEAALWALKHGGTAADAYMTAAIAQCVLEPTMTTLAGGFGLGYFETKSGQMKLTGGGFAPPAALLRDRTVPGFPQRHQYGQHSRPAFPGRRNCSRRG